MLVVLMCFSAMANVAIAGMVIMDMRPTSELSSEDIKDMLNFTGTLCYGSPVARIFQILPMLVKGEGGVVEPCLNATYPAQCVECP